MNKILTRQFLRDGLRNFDRRVANNQTHATCCVLWFTKTPDGGSGFMREKQISREWAELWGAPNEGQGYWLNHPTLAHRQRSYDMDPDKLLYAMRRKMLSAAASGHKDRIAKVRDQLHREGWVR